MYKLLVNTPQGAQEIIEVGQGGGYFDLSLVLWDERIDGEMPHIIVGAMKREKDALVYDATLDSAANAARTKIKIKADIAALEEKVTPRRTREAILGTDNGWLEEQEAAIAALRTQL